MDNLALPLYRPANARPALNDTLGLMASSDCDPAPSTCVLIGAGGHAASVRDVIESVGWRIAFTSTLDTDVQWSGELLHDDAAAIERARVEGRAILIAIGSNKIRGDLLQRIPEELLTPAIASPTATIAISALLGPGTVIHHHAHVGPRTAVGRGTIINTAAVVEHDCKIGEAAHVAPGACVLGGSVVGDGSLIGSGARVLPGVRVGAGAIVGAGAVVTADVPVGVTVTGVPANVMRGARC